MKGQLGFVSPSFRTVRRNDRAPLWKRALARLHRWHELRRQRRQLAALSDYMLKDIGLTRADIEQEIERPFWDDPLKH
ncbi:DUF1127 domain-containing protein [Pseudomonas schmalbachii]|uniref:DUF1127 domain-containing protein n=1 Tax=Pseudomonas schmalbachii TaxID=2816993 RepID=A0ABS3TLW3_9PSED|nr:DUF1127 domain-containing protein [Pseudomonas schmalbachii]MBO3274622.1 DUF1127 domain-containing protein [Pseudomonas schmalbachii]